MYSYAVTDIINTKSYLKVDEFPWNLIFDKFLKTITESLILVTIWQE